MRPRWSSDVDADQRPRSLTPARRRAFIRQHTRLRPVAGVGGVQLHLADDVAPVWRATEAATGVTEAPIPFWAFAWAGGLGLARFVQEHPHEVHGRRVLDLGTGSGLVAIAAALAGAADVTAADVDPFAEAAVALNARSNGVPIRFIERDLLDDQAPPVDVVLAGDTWYDDALAGRVLPWLRAAALAGARVLIGDPGRRYLPTGAFEPLASYDVRTTTRLEDRDVVRVTVATVTRHGPVRSV